MEIVLDIEDAYVDLLRGSGQYHEVVLMFDRPTASERAAIRVYARTRSVLSAWWFRQTWGGGGGLLGVEVLVPGGRVRVVPGGGSTPETFIPD